MLTHEDDWNNLVPAMLLAYRSTKHSSTGFTLAYIYGGRELRFPTQVVFSVPKNEQEPQLINDNAKTLRHN